MAGRNTLSKGFPLPATIILFMLVAISACNTNTPNGHFLGTYAGQTTPSGSAPYADTIVIYGPSQSSDTAYYGGDNGNNGKGVIHGNSMALTGTYLSSQGIYLLPTTGTATLNNNTVTISIHETGYPVTFSFIGTRQ